MVKIQAEMNKMQSAMHLREVLSDAHLSNNAKIALREEFRPGIDKDRTLDITKLTEYDDLYELRGDVIEFVIVDPCADAGVVKEYLTQEQMLARLIAWPIRQPGPDNHARLPVGYRTEAGEAWLPEGWPLGAVP